MAFNIATFEKKEQMVFSGHDTFHCRLFWLKKGIDYLSSGEQFRIDSGVDLGVGKNMVNSMKFWLKSFDVFDEKSDLKQPYEKVFLDGGWDPYLENEGTLYLLHYKLCSRNHSSIYNLIFSNFRKIKPEFTQKNFIDFVRDLDSKQKEKLIIKDFSVFKRMYGQSNGDSLDDGYTGLFTELGLLKEIGKNRNGKTIYRVHNGNQIGIPEAIILYCILINPNYSKTISFSSLYTDDFGVGNIFCFDRDILEDKLKSISNRYKNIVYSSEAGIKELQIKKEIDPVTVLDDYYGL
ncbi:DUF4007 family protein [Aquimarina sp. M1]